jgi:arginyl-tRNA synthetase
MKLNELKNKISEALSEKLGNNVDPEVNFPPEPSMGDLTTNIALSQAAKTGRKPRVVAEELAEALRELDAVESVEVAGPGFINIRLKDPVLSSLVESAAKDKPSTYKSKVVVAEYSDPNPFKVLHVGHLYTSVVGDAIANLLDAAGATVHRVNFGGDVGLHVGRTLWGILQELGGENPDKLADVPEGARASWMASSYIEGTRAYDDDEQAKAKIIELNKRVYRIQQEQDQKSPLAQIYWECRKWSYEYFEKFYGRIGTKFEKYYPESVTAPLGLKAVREQLEQGVYEESAGAVVFRGEKYGLHTRVFITASGLPTYEAKDVGLLMAKWNDYHFDESVVITGNDITEYMKVVLKSVERFEPDLVRRTRHITHGNVKLAGGIKMSSRRGNILGAEEVLDVVWNASEEITGKADAQVVLGATKYAFLKQRIGADLVFIPEESVSLEGNSGPYLQYAHARACSVSRKAGAVAAADTPVYQPAERILAWKISQYPDVIARSVEELMPHHVCGYLYELAQVFNRFYEGNRVIGDEREAVRLGLVRAYAAVLNDGLSILGIAAPEQL